MAKRITAFLFSLVLILALASSSSGFLANANKDESTPAPNDQRTYTRENSIKPITEGGYSGGHDTLMAEGVLLKKGVHKSDTDGGNIFSIWADEALPSFRTGAHDEDSTIPY